MTKKLSMLFALFVCLLVTPVFAAEGDLFSVEATDGNEVQITSGGLLRGAKADYEVFTTGDTLTSAESGKVIILDTSSVVGAPASAANAQFTLPDAEVGLRYTIIAGNGNYVRVRPQSGDRIAYVTLDAGDAIQSAGAVTADSVTVVAGSSSKWYVEEMKGTWTDYGK